MGQGYSVMVILTLIFFFAMMIISLSSPYFPEKLLGLRSSDRYKPTALGFSATILILYNAVSWPSIKNTMMSKDNPPSKAVRTRSPESQDRAQRVSQSVSQSVS